MRGAAPAHGAPKVHIELDARDFGISADLLERELEKALIDAVLDGAHLVEDFWKLYVPENTGTYRDSIHAYLESASPEAATAIITAGLEGIGDYDVYLEFGTHRSKRAASLARKHGQTPATPFRMAPHPSLRPALDAARDALAEALVRPLLEAVE